MSLQKSFSQADISILRNLLKLDDPNATPDRADLQAAYAHVKELIKNDPSVTERTKFWFSSAQKINANDGSLVSVKTIIVRGTN